MTPAQETWLSRPAPHASLGNTPQRRFLLARYLGRAALDVCRGTAAEEDGEALHAIEVELVSHTRNLLLKRNEDDGLSAYLLALPSRLTRDLPRSQRRPGDGFEQELHRQVDRFMSANTDPLQDTFERVLAAAGELYGGAGAEYHGPRLHYLMHLNPTGKPHALPSEIHVAGQIDGSLEGPRSEVRIVLSAKRLGASEWQVLPYVIAHELVVHAFAAGALRSEADGFAEGWMDKVAILLARELCVAEARAMCDAFHESRHVWAPDEARPYGELKALQARGRGRHAAEHVLGRFQRRLGAQAGLAAFQTLSASLNALPLPVLVRGALVQTLVTSTEPLRTRPIPDAAIDAYEAARVRDPATAALAFARAVLPFPFHKSLP